MLIRVARTILQHVVALAGFGRIILLVDVNESLCLIEAQLCTVIEVDVIKTAVVFILDYAACRETLSDLTKYVFGDDLVGYGTAVFVVHLSAVALTVEL